MGYKSAVQILQQAEDLKIKVTTKCDLLNDSEAWTNQQKLQTVYHQVLISDLEYALDRKVEQDLWNIGFKTYITSLQEIARDKKNQRRSDAQALLTWCLEAASGFYISLLQELCNIFDIDLPFRRQGVVYGQNKDQSCLDQTIIPQMSSYLYICQYCLVHLGDIARYRNQRKQAESFYKQAVQVSPTSGHPYNQLALLEASQGNRLSTVFYYVRGIAVKNPFPAATTNLLSTLNSTIEKEGPLEKVQMKMTSNEFINIFLCTHGHLHTSSELDQAEIGVKSLNTVMTALVATESFTLEKLIQLTIINMYALKHITGYDSTATSTELTKDEIKTRELILDLLAGSLSAFLIPVHTIQNDEALLEYYALPAVKYLLEWIQNEPGVLEETVFAKRLQIWPSFCKLLNGIQKYLENFNYEKYSDVPLPEDRSIEGFLPLSKCLRQLNFKIEENDSKIQQLIRAKRIMEFALWLTAHDVKGANLISGNASDGKLVFEPTCIQPDPTDDLLEEIKSFSIEKIADVKKKSPEKKSGILKPQGSLEKSREERNQLTSSESNLALSDNSFSSSSSTTSRSEMAKLKRAKQNVALQSIFKKMEENKQVKFTVEKRDKDKSVKFDKVLPTSLTPPSTTQYNTASVTRTQSFNQNHPAFPITSHQQDYLSTLRNMANTPGGTPSFANPYANPNICYPGQQSIYMPNTGNNKPASGFNISASNPMQGSANGLGCGAPYNVSNPGAGGQGNFKSVNVPPNTFNNLCPQNMQAWPSDGMGQQNWWQQPNNMQGQGFQLPPSYNYSNLPQYSVPSGNPPNQASGDAFQSPWNNYSQPNTQDPNKMNSGNQNMSMRQAMLKEANLPVTVTDKYISSQPNAAPGYSLFNTNNAWNPNLPGQLRSAQNHTENTFSNPTQSLFNSRGPQSLLQLLEQQNQGQLKD